MNSSNLHSVGERGDHNGSLERTSREGYVRNLLRTSRLKERLSTLKVYTHKFFGGSDLDERALLPIIIFQPGKVGSSSVQASLQKKYGELGISVPVYHAHVLENIDKRIEYITKNRKAPQNSIKKLWESKELREQIKNHPEQVWNVINLVREPVALKVSAMFQVLNEYIPDWEKRLKRGKLSMEELEDILYNKQELGTGGLESWYDRQIRSLWGIDVFKDPFSREAGYQIYKRENVNLIIFRLEDLNRVAGKAFDEFLGIKNFEIISVNVGEEKAYADLYQKFKQRPLPASYVDAVYKTRFAQQFYSDLELKQFRQKWTKSAQAQESATISDGKRSIESRLRMPIVIFQPGKVGSMSVMASLKNRFKKLGISTEVHHTHRLEKIDEQIEFVKAARNAPSNTIAKLIESKELRRKIDSHPEQAWNVLTLVRDPVAQRVSALFQLIHEYIPDWQERLKQGQLTLLDLENMLFERDEFEIQRLDNWFDEQMKPVWGVDVYQLPFDCDLGYHIYRPNPKVNLMIIRLEDLDKVAKQAFSEFIGIQNFSVVHTNTSEEKPYRELYHQFKSLPLPPQYVEAAYETRYAQHFYSSKELQTFRNKWTSAG
jgi:hypothetical protein